MATRKKATRNAGRKKPAATKPVARKSGPKKPAARKPRSRKPANRGRVARAAGEALRLAGIGTDAVAKATGKAWDQWLAILDKAGAVSMPHKAIAAWLADKHGVPPWWSRMLTAGYEQARGLREAQQKRDGFAASASRTLHAPLERAYGAWADPNLRALWLGPAPIDIRRSTDGKSLKITWAAGGSSVNVRFQPAGAGKSRVQVEHGELADAGARARQKSFWGEALDRLKAMLEKAA